jgi:uncharacterized protein
VSFERSGNSGAPKVVLDTNILVSALLHPDRNAGIILQLVIEERITSYTSQEIVDEVREVMTRFPFSALVQYYLEHSHLVTPTVHIHVCRDPTDDKFLECAITTETDFIISGDRALLELKEYKGIKIVTAREFLSAPASDIAK